MMYCICSIFDALLCIFSRFAVIFIGMSEMVAIRVALLEAFVDLWLFLTVP